MRPRFLLLSLKDIQLLLFRGQGFIQALLFGLLLIFVFSLASAHSRVIPEAWIAAIFWLASSFSMVLIFNNLFRLEEVNKARLGLLMAPLSRQSIWMGKSLAGLLLLILLQLVFIPACIIFLEANFGKTFLIYLGILFLVDWGLVTLGSLLGALAQEKSGQESLLTIILFPLLIPILLGGIKIGQAIMQESPIQEYTEWIGLIGSFDAVFTGAALILFPFVYSE